VHLTALGNRDIFADGESFIGKVKSDFVGHVGIPIVVERPAATRSVNEMTEAVFLVRAKSRNPARLAVGSPQLRINVVIGIERRDNGVGYAASPSG
jgi:hypothetical protein